MLKSFKKAIFRVLCLGALGVYWGGGLMAEPTPKELVDQGKEIFNFAVHGGGGTFRSDGLEAKEYYIQAKEYFEKACNLNYAKGCTELGGLYEGENLVIGENPSLKERLKKAVQYYSKACDLKDGEGCSFLGLVYELNGYGVVKKDLKKAIQYYVKACELDDVGGCFILLARLTTDKLVTKQEFVQYLSKACELNSGSGCLILGTFYDGGKDKDIKKVVQYYSKACELNSGSGCSSLGAMQYVGKGVVKNEKQAMENFEKACKLGKLGHKEACEIVTYKGLCELGHKEACEMVSLKMLCELSDEKACSIAYNKQKALGF